MLPFDDLIALPLLTFPTKVETVKIGTNGAFVFLVMPVQFES